MEPPRLRRRSPAAVSAALAAFSLGVATPSTSAAKDRSDPEAGFTDPTARTLPPRHRFRMGLELDYIRLTQAVNVTTGESQRFHYVPLQIDFAYQLQFLTWAMIRPSLALGGSVSNTLEAMPFVVHPQLHAGFQGRLLGVALGYGYFHPLYNRPNAVSSARHDLEQPVILHNHHIGGEVSFTTRLHRGHRTAEGKRSIGKGALSFQLRVAGVSSHTVHLDIDRRRWRAMLMFNVGWYFGDGSKQIQRQRERAAERDRRRGSRRRPAARRP